MNLKFVLHHDDHNVPQSVLLEIGGIISRLIDSGEIVEGFFKRELAVAQDVPNSLWGPICGDPPVYDPAPDVFFASRNGREWKDKLVWRHDRPSKIVQVIGVYGGEDWVTLYMIYGGPEAPQNPEDPSNADPENSRLFWAEHALNHWNH